MGPFVGGGLICRRLRGRVVHGRLRASAGSPLRHEFSSSGRSLGRRDSALLAATMGADVPAAWQRRTILVCLFVAVWAISFGRLTDFAAAGYHSFSLELLSRRLVQFALAFATSLALLGVPIACATRLSLGTSTGRVVWILVGAACGLVVATQIVGPFLGTQWVLWIAAASGLIAVATRRRLDDSAQAQASGSTTVLWPLCGFLWPSASRPPRSAD